MDNKLLEALIKSLEYDFAVTQTAEEIQIKDGDSKITYVIPLKDFGVKALKGDIEYLSGYKEYEPNDGFRYLVLYHKFIHLVKNRK